MPGGSMPSLRARWTAVCLALAVSLVVPTLLPAEGLDRSILGRLGAASGAVVANVKVTAKNDATGIARDTEPNASGDYVFPELPVGTYTLSFDLSGFKTNVRKSVTLDVNQVITLNMTMQIGASKEVVEVTSEAPLVDTTSTQLGAVVNDRAVSQLPLNSRDAYQFLQLQTGGMSTVGSSNTVVYGIDKAGPVSGNGGRRRSYKVYVNLRDCHGPVVN